jgi:hypothetical protein
VNKLLGAAGDAFHVVGGGRRPHCGYNIIFCKSHRHLSLFFCVFVFCFLKHIPSYQILCDCPSHKHTCHFRMIVVRNTKRNRFRNRPTPRRSSRVDSEKRFRGVSLVREAPPLFQNTKFSVVIRHWSNDSIFSVFGPSSYSGLNLYQY